MPRRDSTAAINQVSNSHFAKTTATGTSAPAAVTARAYNSGPSVAGQSSSLSSKTITTPQPPALSAASLTARSSSPGRNSLLFGIRTGAGVAGTMGSDRASPMRLTKCGAAATSACPSTTKAKRLKSVVDGTEERWHAFLSPFEFLGVWHQLVHTQEFSRRIESLA